ncbi:hypothetical protein F8388_001730 [Cannabis sativa]|uniref:RNase H type-1 domain-containing protein n=1 Tax=Cannabis sativa TaxID=3483 RepID=A0A7J6HJ95_CANSA|nr:hypothetical protein F8388_001730 [Cannabis sativa]
MASTSTSASGLFSPAVAKTIAVLHGIQLCLRLGYVEVDIGMDCQRVVLHFSKEESYLAEFDFVLHDILKLCGGSSLFKFILYNHSTNDITHKLAKLVPNEVVSSFNKQIALTKLVIDLQIRSMLANHYHLHHSLLPCLVFRVTLFLCPSTNNRVFDGVKLTRPLSKVGKYF